jgi:hypothetical protein
MRTFPVAAILFGAIITPVILAAPSHAKSSDLRTSDLKSADLAKPADVASAPPCYSYEQNPNGTWRQTACQEVGAQAAQTAAARKAGRKASR